MYEAADTNRNSSWLLAMVAEMRNLPEDVASVENNWTAGTRTYVYKNGRRVTSSISKAQASAKPSTSRSVKSSAASDLKASLKKTMREADQNISEFIKRIAQLDIEISRATVRGQYAGTMKYKRDNLVQKIKQLEGVKSRCAALLSGA